MGVRVGILPLSLAGGPYICVCGFFFCGGGAVYPLLLLGGGGGLGSSCASFGVTVQRFSWDTCGFPLCVVQLAPLLGFHT